MTANGAKDLLVSQIAVGQDIGLTSERCNLTKKTNRKGKCKIVTYVNKKYTCFLSDVEST